MSVIRIRLAKAMFKGEEVGKKRAGPARRLC